MPFVDGKGAKPRTVLVTFPPNSKGDVLGIPGTSRLDQWQEPHQAALQPADLAVGRLDQPTVFPTSKQMRLSEEMLDVAGEIAFFNHIHPHLTIANQSAFKGFAP